MPSKLTLAAALVVATSPLPARASVTAVEVSANRFMPNDPRVAVSADGRYVTYEAVLATGCNGGLTTAPQPKASDCVSQVYVYDAKTKKTDLISRTSTGGPGNGNSTHPSISADGRYVAFRSVATNLVSGKVVLPVYVYDRTKRKVTRIKVPGWVRADHANVIYPRITGDGNAILLDPGTNLAKGEYTYIESGPLYLSTWRTGRLDTVTLTSAGALANHGYYGDGLSRTGRYVAFSSNSPLTPSDTDQSSDIYVRDTVAGKTVSVTATIPDECDAVAQVQGCTTQYWFPRMDAAGRMVTFEIGGPRNNTPSQRHIGVRDLVSGKLWVEPFDAFEVDTYQPVIAVPHVQELAMSGDGKHVFVATDGELSGGYASSLWDWEFQAGKMTRVSGGITYAQPGWSGTYTWPAPAADGKSVAAMTTAPLDSHDTDSDYDVYLFTGWR